MNGKESVRDFFSNESFLGDRWVFIFVCITVVVGLSSLALDSNFICLREFDFKGKATALLLFSPVIVFLLWICLALLPFSRNLLSKFLRIVVYLIFFFLFNF